jgi:hypothetical protein
MRSLLVVSLLSLVLPLAIVPVATATCTFTTCASVGATAIGGCGVTCSWKYSADGTATGVSFVTGSLALTGAVTDPCTGTNTCESSTADPVAYPIGTCHSATMTAGAVLVAVATLRIHC